MQDTTPVLELMHHERRSIASDWFHCSLWLRFVDRYTVGKNDPWLGAARPVVRGWLEPGRVVQGAASDDALLVGSDDVQPGTSANPDTAIGADPAVADRTTAKNALDPARCAGEVECFSRNDHTDAEPVKDWQSVQ